MPEFLFYKVTGAHLAGLLNKRIQVTNHLCKIFRSSFFAEYLLRRGVEGGGGGGYIYSKSMGPGSLCISYMSHMAGFGC